MEFTQVHAERLLRLADVVETSTIYNQGQVGRPDCGTPGCLLGHARMIFSIPEDIGCGNFLGIGITDPASTELFDAVRWCGRAGTDGKKAAAYVRDFVARKLASMPAPQYTMVEAA
jgi:hypothetical protein